MWKYASNSLLYVGSLFFMSPVTCKFALECLFYTPDPLTGCFLCCVLERGKIFVRYFPNTFCVTMKFGFVSVNMQTLRITNFLVDSWSVITCYSWYVVWCAVSATRIIVSFFLYRSISSQWYATLFERLFNYEWTCLFAARQCNSLHHR
jgi:hypothetical protein